MASFSALDLITYIFKYLNDIYSEPIANTNQKKKELIQRTQINRLKKILINLTITSRIEEC